MTTKNILAIHDISCIGRCSMTVALPIISAFGLECRSLPTALLSTHTGGFTGYTYLDLTEEMKKILKAWQPLNLKFDAIYSGFMSSPQQIDVLKDIFSYYSDAKRIIDPVMADDGKLYSVFDHDFVEKMRELVPSADVLLPNITEACLLTETPYQEIQNESFVDRLLDKLHKLGAREIVLTGVSYQADKIGVAVLNYDGHRQTYFNEKVGSTYHGTGDIFGSVFAAGYTLGKSLLASASQAADFTLAAIKATPEPTDKRFGVNFEVALSQRSISDEK